MPDAMLEAVVAPEVEAAEGLAAVVEALAAAALVAEPQLELPATTAISMGMMAMLARAASACSLTPLVPTRLP